MRYHLTEQLGPSQSLTPEGYLLCEAVPIARTGTQVYAAHEHPGLEPGPDGLITVIRDSADVFRPETMASFEGKSITIGHAFVDPDNYSELEVGQVLNVRRSDVETDLMIADLLFKDADAIEKVRTKKDIFGSTIDAEMRDLSCGYDADYEQTEPGIARQKNIIGNHVAVVPRGRAGIRCSIQDEDIEIMTTTTQSTLLQKLLRAIKTGDAATVKKTTDEAEAEIEKEKKTADEEAAAAKDKETQDTIADLKKTVDALSEELADMKKTKDAGPIGQASALMEGENLEIKDEATDLMSRAEAIVPGMSLPTADAMTTKESLTVLKKRVLNQGLKNEVGKEVITNLLRGKTVDSLGAEGVDAVFHAASELLGDKHNSVELGSYRTQDNERKGAPTIAEINERNKKFYAV